MAKPALGDLSRLSHAYLISAASRSEGLEVAGTIAQAAVCSGEKPPCGQCRDCRKAKAGVHPDIEIVGRLDDGKGKIKRDIGVDQIRRLISDSVVLPNEAGRKVYIIDQADTMNGPAQNAALKLLEEPPKGVVFLLCAENSQALLPTVRSRCAEINCNGSAQEEDGETRKIAAGYLQAVATGDRAKLFAWCFGNDGLDTLSASAFANSVQSQIADMLCSGGDSLGLSRERLFYLYKLMERVEAYLKVNTGVKHIFGLLAVDSIPAEETEEK